MLQNGGAMSQYGIGYLIKTISERMKAIGDQDLREEDLTYSQARVLGVLERAGGTLAQKEIERIIGVAHPTVTGLISRLTEKGFVECETDSSDRRNKIVRLTPKAEALGKVMRKKRHQAEDALLAGLSEEEILKLQDLLGHLYNNIEERKV